MLSAALLLTLSIAASPAETSASPPSSEKHLVSAKTFSAISGELSGEQAIETVRRIVDQHRIQGSAMMARSAELVASELKVAGVEATLETFRSDGATRYGVFTSPMAWEINSGELWVLGDEPFRLSRYADVPMSVSTYSKGGDWTGELVEVGSGTDDESYAKVDVAGKVVLAYGYAQNVHKKAVLERHALGMVIYPKPGDRPDHPDMIRYNGIWTRADEVAKASGGFQISTNQYLKLKDLMAKGPVKVHGTIDATLSAGKMTLVHAYLRGTTKPDQEIIVIGHLDHPKWSANDNASGAGTLVEVARTLSRLIKKGAIAKPALTIHFVWVPEFLGSAAWLANHPEVRRCGAWDDPRAKSKKVLPQTTCVLAGLNLDMVGENTVLTDSQFYFTRTPDSVPSFLDALLSDVLEQTREASLVAPTGTRHLWPAVMLPYSQGSDHDLLLGLGIPATMIGHWPDWTHHTSEDRLDKVDSSELLRSGVFSAAAAHWMAAATAADWQRLEELRRADEIAKTAMRIPGSSPARAARMKTKLTELVQNQKRAQLPANPKSPRKLVFLPYDEVLEDRNADEQKFWDESEKKFGEKNIELVLPIYEAVNLLDGKRTSNDIAEALVDELDVAVDAAWVDRMFALLARKKLITAP